MDIGRRPFLAGMGDALQPGGTGGGEDAGELARRMAELGRVEADGGDLIQPRLGRLERDERIFLVEMAEEAEDEL